MENHQGHHVEARTQNQNAVAKWTFICVGVVIALIVAVKFFNVSVNTLAYGAVLLACPLMHILMMRGGNHKH